MSAIRFAFAAVLLTGALWAQSPAPTNPNSSAPTPSAATPPPDSTVLVATKKIKPAYPPAAVPEKLQGQVIVRIVVDEDGDVENAEVISGNPVLADAAVDAAKQWKFKPFIKNGRPVKAAVKLPFDFAPPADTAPTPTDAGGTAEKRGDAASAGAPTRVRVSSDVIQGLILHREYPVYPIAAKQAKVQGTVILKAIISKEGTIKELQVISGDPLLLQAAIDAVKPWRYRPYILNGEPVEIETQIEVQFALAH
jgi:TonB family protein